MHGSHLRCGMKPSGGPFRLQCPTPRHPCGSSDGSRRQGGRHSPVFESGTHQSKPGLRERCSRWKSSNLMKCTWPLNPVMCGHEMAPSSCSRFGRGSSRCRWGRAICSQAGSRCPSRFSRASCGCGRSGRSSIPWSTELRRVQVCLLAYYLQVTLRKRLDAQAPDLTLREVLATLAGILMPR